MNTAKKVTTTNVNKARKLIDDEIKSVKNVTINFIEGKEPVVMKRFHQVSVEGLAYVVPKINNTALRVLYMLITFSDIQSNIILNREGTPATYKDLIEEVSFIKERAFRRAMQDLANAKALSKIKSPALGTTSTVFVLNPYLCKSYKTTPTKIKHLFNPFPTPKPR